MEIGIENDVNKHLILAYSVCTTLLVSVHLLALMISTCILPNIEATSNGDKGDVDESPHEAMQCIIQIAWTFSTGFGIILFLCEIVLISWIKFDTKQANNNKAAALASSAIVIPVAVILIMFAVYFWKKLIKHAEKVIEKKLIEMGRVVVNKDGSPV